MRENIWQQPVASIAAKDLSAPDRAVSNMLVRVIMIVSFGVMAVLQ
jgi:hypothetical protein